MKPTFYSKTTYDRSCSNQNGGLRGDSFSWYSDEDMSGNEQEIEKKPE
jgi:hypothetical protein